MTATSTGDGLGLDREGQAPAAPAADGVDAATDGVTTSTALVPVRTPPVAAPTVPGAGLVAEAERAVAERRWRRAMRILDAIDSIGASSVRTDGLLALAATHLNKGRTAAEAIARIQAAPQTVESHRALAAVSIARHEYLIADRELRATLDLIDRDHGEQTAADWANFGAVYAGLGWFDHASECLDNAERLDADDNDRWIVGRSLNHWAMSRTWALPIGALLFYFIGLLAVAVGITVPFIVRELRLTRLDERMATLASDA